MIGSVIYKLHMLETAYLDLAVSQCFSFVLLGCHCIISNQGLLIGQGQDVVWVSGFPTIAQGQIVLAFQRGCIAYEEERTLQKIPCARLTNS